jgi:hypothetical protein
MSWITRTMENMDQLLEASKFDPGKELDDFDPRKPSETERQEAYINSSLERCRRCGDHTFLMFPAGLQTLCSECESDLRVLEDESLETRPFWFYEIVVKAQGGKKKGGRHGSKQEEPAR